MAFLIPSESFWSHDMVSIIYSTSTSQTNGKSRVFLDPCWRNTWEYTGGNYTLCIVLDSQSLRTCEKGEENKWSVKDLPNSEHKDMVSEWYWNLLECSAALLKKLQESHVSRILWLCWVWVLLHMFCLRHIEGGEFPCVASQLPGARQSQALLA